MLGPGVSARACGLGTMAPPPTLPQSTALSSKGPGFSWPGLRGEGPQVHGARVCVCVYVGSMRYFMTTQRPYTNSPRPRAPAGIEVPASAIDCRVASPRSGCRGPCTAGGPSPRAHVSRPPTPQCRGDEAPPCTPHLKGMIRPGWRSCRPQTAPGEPQAGGGPQPAPSPRRSCRHGAEGQRAGTEVDRHCDRRHVAPASAGPAARRAEDTCVTIHTATSVKAACGR